MNPNRYFYWDGRPGQQTWRHRGCGCTVLFWPDCTSQPPRGARLAVCSCPIRFVRERLPAGRLTAWRPVSLDHPARYQRRRLADGRWSGLQWVDS